MLRLAVLNLARGTTSCLPRESLQSCLFYHLSTRCRIVVFILDSKRNDDDGVNTRTDSSFEKA
jgi:hypothetical protein